MAQVSNYLRDFANFGDEDTNGFAHYCPGCDELHLIYLVHNGKKRWTFDNNDLDKPSFSPSVRTYKPADKELKTPELTLCHYFLKNGMIQFLNDCAHDLKGQTVPLPLLPPNWRDD